MNRNSRRIPVRRTFARAAILAATFAGAPSIQADEATRTQSIAAVVSDRSAMPTLSMDAAVAEALARNPRLAEGRARVREAEGALRSARRWFPQGPQINLETARRESPTENSRDLSIGISQSLWIAGQGGLAAQAARSEREVAMQRLDAMRTRIAADTRRAFLEVLVAGEELETAERLVETLGALAAFADRRLEAGAATVLDVNTAQIGLALARAERESARLHRLEARVRLAELLNRDPDASLAAEGEVQAWSLTLPGREDLLNRAVLRRGDLAAASARTTAARARLTAAERGWVPNPTIRAFYGEEEDFEITGVGVSLPLPSLGGYRGRSEAAAARLDAASYDEDRLRLAVRTEVLQALAAYRAAAARVGFLGRDRLALAEENFELTLQAWRTGKVAAPALAVAQDRLGESRRDYLSALDELVVAVTELEWATGGLVRLGAGTPAQEEDPQ